MAQALGFRRLQEYLQGSRVLSGSPVWLLGECYEAEEAFDEPETLPEEVASRVAEDFASRIWMTYRWDFPVLGEELGISSDVGWGCTIRSGQMLVAQALLHHVLGRTWRRPSALDDEPPSEELAGILQHFADDYSSALSIHNICLVGANNGVVAGEWLGPWVLSHVLQSVINTHRPNGLGAIVISQPGGGAPQINKSRLNDYFAAFQDTVGEIDELECQSSDEAKLEDSSEELPVPETDVTTGSDDCSIANQLPKESQPTSHPEKSSHSDEEHSPFSLDGPAPSFVSGFIILIPLVLGVGKVDATYRAQLKEVMKWPQSLGIVGGRPSSSLYFIGYQDDSVIYLDPHEPQEVSDGKDYSTYFCQTLRHMPLASIDPSLAIGFYCKTPESFEDVVARLEKLERDVSGGTPLVSIIDCQESAVSDVYELEDSLLCTDDDAGSERKDEWEMV